VVDIRDRSVGVRRAVLAVGFVLILVGNGSALAQLPLTESQVGELVPRDVREIYDRGLVFLASTQLDNGSWGPGDQRPGMTSGLETSASFDASWARQSEQGAGVTGLALLAILASGEDANFGIYSGHIRKGIRSLINTQDPSTGYFGLSMYHHGFAMLALAEAYGMVDERNLWPDGKPPRSVGQALELAVRAAITAQKANPSGAWRYYPESKDADTSISGAVLVGLLAARNAGIEVPDEAIDRAIVYFRSMTARTGDIFYIGQAAPVDTFARTSIGNLIYAIARRKNLPEYKATLSFLTQRIEEPPGVFHEYIRYYEAQALFQGDIDAWERWNRILIWQTKNAQLPDGSIQGRFAPTISTSLSLLSLALNYRFLPIYER